MKSSTLIALVLMAASVGVAGEDFAPGVQHVCVPNAAHDGWDCGTVDEPPTPSAPAQEIVDEPAPLPPPFLANPEGQADTSYLRQRRVRAAPQAEAAVEPEPEVPAAVVDATTAEPEVAVEPVSESIAVAEPLAAEAEPLPEPVVEPVADPIVDTQPASMPEPASTATATETSAVAEDLEVNQAQALPEPEPAPAPIVEAPGAATVAAQPQSTRPSPPAATPTATPASASSPPVRVSSLQGARAFASLTATHYTLQLAYAKTPDTIPLLIQQLGIDPAQCYLLRVRRDGGDWWVLSYGDYADVASAKSALARIHPVAGMAAVWPRRIGYLQSEYQP